MKIVLNSKVFVGWTSQSSMMIIYLAEKLRREWVNCYDVIGRNCNDFAEAFSRELTGQGIPAWINSLARTGTSLFDVFGLGPEGKFRRTEGGFVQSTKHRKEVYYKQVSARRAAIEDNHNMATRLLLSEQYSGDRVCTSLPKPAVEARSCEVMLW